jgi:hypothetical protein
MDNRGIGLAKGYYSKTDLENLSDGEILDLIYEVFETYKGPDYAKLDLIKEVLDLAETTNEGAK